MNLLLLLTVIYNSGYYISTTYFGSNIAIILLCCSIGIIFFKKGLVKGGLTYNEFFLLLLFTVAIVGSELANGRTPGLSSLKVIFVIILSLLIAKIIPWADFKKVFVKTMVVISIFAIVGEIFFKTKTVLNLPIIKNYNNIEYVSGYLFAKIIYEYVGVSERMQGVFWEPGLLATYLILALLFCEKEMFAQKKNYYFVICLFVISTVLTLSAAGLLMLPIVLIYKLCKQKSISIHMISLLIVLLGAIVYVLIFHSAFLEKYLFSKLLDDDNISNYTRWNAFYIDIKVFISSFPFGVGNSGYGSALRQYHEESLSLGTSTLTSYLAYYGVWGIIIVGLWINCIFNINKKTNIVSRICTIILIILILSKEPHGSMLFTNCIFMYHTFYINRNYVGDRKNEFKNKKNFCRQRI